MPLRDICKRNVICINPQATVLEAARIMKSRHVGDLIVIDPHAIPPRPVGIITDRDIVTLVVAADVAAADVLVEDVMARHLQTACHDDGLFDVTRKMRETGVRRLPVVDDRGGLIGVVSIDDIYQLLSTEFRNLAAVSASQVATERSADVAQLRF